MSPLTALAFVLIIRTPERFHRGEQIGSYIGLIPSEDSNGGRERLGTSASRHRKGERRPLDWASRSLVRGSSKK
jgi:transposase